MCAADAQVGHDAGDLARRLDTAGRIKRHDRPAGEGRQQDDAGGTSRRTAIDRCLLVNDRFGIRLATVIAALRALGLRQQMIDLPDLLVAIGRALATRAGTGHRDVRLKARQTQACSLMKSLIWGRTRVRQRRPLKMP